MDNREIKVALYARVSTKNKQEVENQLHQLREYCQKNGYAIQKEYVDHESGGNPDRKEFKELFRDAYQKRFDLVLFWALDRFSREGAKDTINYLSQLEGYGVDFISFTEPYLNSIGIFKEAIISLLATLARQEKVRIQSRIKAAMELCRLRGVRVGRKPTPPMYLAQIIEIHENEKLSVREIASKTNIPRSTVFRTIKQFKEGVIDKEGLPINGNGAVPKGSTFSCV
jgi:DNA invertase Pin-like site-specific DNA recombinase